MPRISPARTSKSIGAAAPAGSSPLTFRRTSPIVRLVAGYSDSIWRPTIDAIRLSWSNSDIGLHVTRPPSRSTVTRSPISNISSRWWVTYITAWPSSRSWWIRASSALVSASDSAVVGSSKISTRGDSPSTLAISTSCWTASDSVPTSVPGSSESRPTRSSIARAWLCNSRGRVIPRWAGRWPISRFSATERSGRRLSSW